MSKRRRITPAERKTILEANGRICEIAGCGKPIFNFTWCSAHYNRWRRHGDPLAGRIPPKSRYAFIEIAVTFDGDDCLLWPHGTNGAGYGQIRIKGQSFLAHRVVCERVYGTPPLDKQLCLHRCGNGHLGCVNPRHLRWGTIAENAKDAIYHGVTAKGERNGSAKLTKEHIFQIRRLDGILTKSEIAARFGIARSAVGNIINRKRWGWLEDAR